MRQLAIAILLLTATDAGAADAPADLQKENLLLRKALAEAKMENFQLRYERLRREWLEIKKQLGEPVNEGAREAKDKQ